VHEEYAGVSAFVNGPADDAERGAQFVAVGGLVELSYGRLGRGWLVAERLKGIARLVLWRVGDVEMWEGGVLDIHISNPERTAVRQGHDSNSLIGRYPKTQTTQHPSKNSGNSNRNPILQPRRPKPRNPEVTADRERCRL
jgi:hypothetical protein